MTMSRSRVGAVLVAAAVVVITMQVASGWVGVVTTRGVSMEPSYSQGDVVVTRRTGSYEVGDVIAYRSRELGDEVILHRVVEREGNHLRTQGDGNDWIDHDRPTPADVVGEAWFHLPGAGRFLAPIRQLGPVVSGAALLLIFLALSSRPSPADPPPRRIPVPTSLRTHLLQHQVTTWAFVALVASALLAVAGYRAPTSTREPVEQTVEHRGRFSYEARVDRSIVYPDGSVDTGDPVFRSATDDLTVRYDHEVDAPAGVEVEGGTVRGDVVVRIGSWEHPLAELGPVALVDGRASLEATVAADEVDAVVDGYRAVSGAATDQAVVVVRPTVKADIAGAATPTSTAALDALELTVGAREIGVAEDQLTTTAADPVPVPTWQQRSIAVLGRRIAARDARIVGALGVVVAGSVLAAAALSRRRSPASAPIIAAAHGRIVPVSYLELLGDVVDVLDRDAFVRIAEASDALVLHSTGDDGDETFVVEDGRARYRFSTTGSGRAA